ncbi:MAG: hypothetical protein AWM53_00912 [Candidatus Dichloromethanomonas elyunquensis]|nr:MAG: hypothetical protein AWM53_00912 [Candidatus Dichloromethanomonas elyunquensis]
MGNIWIADGHCDSLGDLTDGKRDLQKSAYFGHWDIMKAKEANIGLQFFAAYIESEYKPFLAMQRGLQHIEAARRFIDHSQDEVFLVSCSDDLQYLGKNGKIGLLLHVEGGEILAENIFMLDIIYRLGVRSLGLTWNQRNAIADGIGERQSSGGLSQFGLNVISKMNELGMIIDVSHINKAGFWDVLHHSNSPVIASHSCAQTLCQHPRNLDDEQLKALAGSKGVVGINFCKDFLCESGEANMDDIVKHICHIAEVAGIDTVGFGSDFDGIPSTPDGFENVSKYPLLIEKLYQRSFSMMEIEKICHGNFVRVLQNVLK